MKAQMRPLTTSLTRSGVATFEWLEGTIPTEAGPGVDGMFEGPYYQYFSWPPTNSDEDEQSIQEACEDLEDYLEENGPFDGILGFSHGSTLLTEFLCDYAKRYPEREPPCRCAVFISGIPPYRMDENNEPVIDSEVLKHFPNIPTLHVVGKKDFVFKYSTILHAATISYGATLISHEKGHEIPTDTKILHKINASFEQLSHQIAFG